MQMACNPVQCHAFEVYPESNDIDLLVKVISGMNVPCTYILHDKDIDAAGNLKKPHYHIMTGFPLNAHQRTTITKACGVSYFLQVRDKENMYAYLTHSREKDKQEGKHQYEECERCFNNVVFDWDDFKNFVDVPDDYFLLQQIYNIIDSNDIIYYKDLVHWCSLNNFELFKICHKYSYSILSYIRSNEYTCHSLSPMAHIK